MNLLYANDRPGAYPASYYAASVPPTPVSPALTDHVTADVVVVGAGYTGLSAALHLAQAGRDVVLLDAHRIGWGASGRNGGQVGSGQRVDQPELEKMLGERRARQLWDLGEDAKRLVKRLIRYGELDCDLRPGILYTDHKASRTGEMQAYVDHMNEVYDYPVTYLDREAVQSELGTQAYACGALDGRGAHLHPLKYAQGLGRIARAEGVRVFENTPVTTLAPGKVTTAQGSIRTRQIVLATNGYMGELAPKVARHVMPINNYIVATEPLGKERARSLIRRNIAVADAKFVVNYFRLSADHRLLFGGGESYSYRFPKDIASKARGPMLEIYPQLRDVKIDYAWGGTLGITMSRLPYLSDLGDGIFSASGYSGHGVALATLSGALMAEAITGDRSRFEAIAAIPAQPFPGPRRWRTPLLMLAMSYYALRDRL